MIGEIEYTDEEMVIQATKGFTDKDSERDVMMKYTKWSYEEEFRFLTHTIKDNIRARTFSKDVIAEIILGKDCNHRTIREILTACKERFPNTPIFQAKVDADNLTTKPVYIH